MCGLETTFHNFSLINKLFRCIDIHDYVSVAKIRVLRGDRKADGKGWERLAYCVILSLCVGGDKR